MEGKPAIPYFQARQRPIASTGRQGNCHSACRASTECDAAQMRNAVSLPDTHSEAKGVGVRTRVPYGARKVKTAKRSRSQIMPYSFASTVRKALRAL